MKGCRWMRIPCRIQISCTEVYYPEILRPESDLRSPTPPLYWDVLICVSQPVLWIGRLVPIPIGIHPAFHFDAIQMRIRIHNTDNTDDRYLLFRESFLAIKQVLWIRLNWIRIRIRIRFLPLKWIRVRIQGLMTKKITAEFFFIYPFLIKNCNLLNPWPS